MRRRKKREVKPINETNKKYLEHYRFLCMNKGMTQKSISAICDNDLRLFLEWLRDKVLTDVTHLDIQEFMMHCVMVRGNKDKALNRKHTNLNMFYRRLIINMDLEIKNPLDKVDKPKIRKKVHRYLKMQEFQALNDFLESKGLLRDIALIYLMFSSACRVGEIEQLDIKTLNFTTRRFVVTGKGEKQRECMFTREAAEKIKAYLATREDDNPALFLSKLNTRLTAKAIQDNLRRYGKSAGIEQGVHPHLFRHGRAMQLLKAGATLETIQRILGHESIATTQIYAEMDFDSVQDAVDKIDMGLLEEVAEYLEGEQEIGEISEEQAK